MAGSPQPVQAETISKASASFKFVPTNKCKQNHHKTQAHLSYLKRAFFYFNSKTGLLKIFHFNRNPNSVYVNPATETEAILLCPP